VNGVDVLAVMVEAQCLAEHYDEAELPHDLREAHAAVAQLIEADRRYDNAQFGLARARYNGEPLEQWAALCAQADILRAAALARCGVKP